MTARNTDVLESIEKQATAFDVFKAKHDDIMNDVRTKQAEIQERLEEIEAKQSSPGRTTDGGPRINQEHKQAFCNWLRKPTDSSTKQALENIETELQKKGVLIGTPSAGGYAVPEELLREIERFEKKFSPVRDLVKVQMVGTGDVRSVVNLRGASSGWVGESDARSESDTSAMREIVYTGGELYSYPKASNWSLDDIFFDVGSWLAEEVGQSFAEQEGVAVIRGDGSNKPTGMLNDPPTTRDDFDSPIRDVDEFQYITDGDSPFALDADTLVDLVYKVNSAYRSGATWAMNSATAGFIRKLKHDDKYVWADGLQAGQPNLLLGYPVAIWEDMDDIDVTGGSNMTFPVAFGDFRRAYTLLDRHDVRITRDEVTQPGFTKFYVRKRVYGHPVNTNAVKWIATAA